jgi:SAM-dependent methyltransferase
MLYSGANPDYELAGRSLPDRLKDLFAEQVVRSAHREMGLAIRSVLDYGTGGGRYAAAAARSSPSATVTGTDFAPTPPAGSYFGSHGRLQYIPYDKLDNSTRFDLVIARHVLEHVHDPIALLRDLLARTTPAGAVYIEVPNLRSRTAALVGVKWPLFFVPRHVSHFTRSSLSAAITRAGGVGPVKRAEMPLMSNVLAISLGAIRYDDRFKIPGMLLHPVQLAIESLASEGTCLRAVVRRA